MTRLAADLTTLAATAAVLLVPLAATAASTPRCAHPESSVGAAGCPGSRTGFTGGIR